MPEWGGLRPGAGRKPKEPGKTRVSLSTRISEESAERLRAYSKLSGKSLGEVIDELAATLSAVVPAAPAKKVPGTSATSQEAAEGR